MRRARDFAQVKSEGKITREVACMALDRMGIDESGLDGVDRRILVSLVEKYKGGPCFGLISWSCKKQYVPESGSECDDLVLRSTGYINQGKWASKAETGGL